MTGPELLTEVWKLRRWWLTPIVIGALLAAALIWFGADADSVPFHYLQR